MSARLLAEAMGNTIPLARYEALLPAATQSLRDCGCTTIDRIAMWVAQLGHESAGLKYMEELASGDAYEGRHDLGNTQPGDGRRFKGRGPIQVTGRHNYTALSRWAHQQGFTPTATFFADHPHELASDRYGFLGATWYWTVARPQLNEAADRCDLVWATKLINGGTNGVDDRRRRYNNATAMGARLLGLLEGGDVPTSRPDKRLSYDRGVVPQLTGYTCGPGATEIVLNARGVIVPEMQLAKEMGTHTGGTDHIGLVTNVLNKYLPQAKYRNVQLPKDPPTAAQRDTLWADIVAAIDNNYGIVANWVAPPTNYPRGIKGSVSPRYGPGVIYHYVAIAGYGWEGDTPAVWIADSAAFGGITGYWISLHQCATLIPPKGYSTPTVAAVEPPEVPAPIPPSKQPLDIIVKEVTQRLPGRTFDDELRDLIIDPYRPDTVLGHSINSASLSRINFELLQRIARHLDIPIDDIR